MQRQELRQFAGFFGVFQSSPVPEDGCNGSVHSEPTAFLKVSILTRPGGRVQRRDVERNERTGGFQSSPVPEDGCNREAFLRLGDA